VQEDCAGIEATFRLRQDLGLSRKTAVVASVGSSFSLADGIEAGPLAKYSGFMRSQMAIARFQV